MFRKGSFLLIAASSILAANNFNSHSSNLAAMCTPPVEPIRFTSVTGYDGRTNDIIYCARRQHEPLRLRLIFFGGDIQDYPEVMDAHRDNHRYVKWNLVDTAVVLRDQFPNTDVFVVRPKRMVLKTFACYDNFVIAKDFGIPDHVRDHGALRLLRSLLVSVLALADERTNSPQASLIGDVPVTLVGFSKGCVVLNQLVYELQLTETNAELKQFVDRIDKIYWLDGGHAGGSNLWITKPDILKYLAKTGIEIRVFMSPYQLNDERRPWLRKECKTFVDILKRLHAKLTYTVLFMDEERSIEMHFNVLMHIGL